MVPKLADPILAPFLNAFMRKNADLDTCIMNAFTGGQKENNHTPILICEKTNDGPRWRLFVFVQNSLMPFGIPMPACTACMVQLGLTGCSKAPKHITVHCDRCKKKWKIKCPLWARSVCKRKDLFELPYPVEGKLDLIPLGCSDGDGGSEGVQTAGPSK